jgi:hypothetical protein
MNCCVPYYRCRDLRDKIPKGTSENKAKPDEKKKKKTCSAGCPYLSNSKAVDMLRLTTLTEVLDIEDLVIKYVLFLNNGNCFITNLM